MSDLISRQAAIELVKDVCDAIMSGCESWYDPETEDEVYTDIREVDAILKCNKEVRIALRNMPSAQPEPKRGKWIDKGITGDWQYQTDGRGSSWHEWQCDQCKDMVTKRSFYCPNCGADMREVTT